LPDGDKTYVMLSTQGQEPPPEEEGQPKPKKTVPKPQTLYNLIRDLEKQNNTDLMLSSYGKITPKNEAGLHGYEFRTDIPAEKRIQFNLKALPEGGKKKEPYKAENIMLPGLTRDGFKGHVAVCCKVCWTLAKHDSCNHLKAS